MFAKWTDEMVCEYFDTHWNTSLHEVCTLSGRSMDEVKQALMIAEPPEHWSNTELEDHFRSKTDGC